MRIATTLFPLVASGFLLTGLVSCSKPQDAPAPESNLPLTYSHGDENAEVSLTLPEDFKRFPALHETLYTESEAELKAFTENATTTRADLKKEGFDSPPYFRTTVWHLSGETPQLASFYAEHAEFTGGAHGNMNFQTILWNKADNQPLDTASLFKPDADFKEADAYLCTQVEAERSRRNETPTRQTATGFTCPKLLESRLILIPSVTPEKFGAVEALYAPYDVGPYAEGPYQIRIPQTLLRNVIAPDYLADFAGEAVAPVAEDNAA
ncbi:MAG: DUF4163 domain-containing protein [Asticcacaulis sp.]